MATPASPTVRWGLLSTARINRKILAGAALSSRVEILAVGARDQARADAYARDHGIERAYGSYDDLLSDPDVEAVYISLPNGLHVEWAIRALAAGKHVLCEKPLTASPAEAERAFDVAEAHGLVLSEAFMWRHHPQTHELVRLVQSGALGTLRLVRAAFSFHLTAGDDIRLNPALEGGSLMDVGCYCVSAIRLLAGEPVCVYGEQVLGPSGVDVRFAGTAVCADDVLAHFDCGLEMPYRAALEVAGEDGVALLSDPWHATRPGIVLRRRDEVEHVEVPEANSYRLQLENVSAAIREEAPLLLGREDAVAQARALEALYAAAAAGAAVEIATAPRLEHA
ncbi:MAG: Gfo/Idh/MocA family protein [Gaiellaceae bacterium]